MWLNAKLLYARSTLNIQSGEAALQLAKGNGTGHAGKIVFGELWSSSQTDEKTRTPAAIISSTWGGRRENLAVLEMKIVFVAPYARKRPLGKSLVFFSLIA